MAATRVLQLPNYFASADADLSDHPKPATSDQDAYKQLVTNTHGSTSGFGTCALYRAAANPIAAAVPHQCSSGSSGAHLRSKTEPVVAQWLVAANFFAPYFC